MKNKTLSFAMISLIAGVAAFGSSPAFAERTSDNIHRSENQQTRGDYRGQGHEAKTPRVERKSQSRAERQRSIRSESGVQHSDSRNSARDERVERKTPKNAFESRKIQREQKSQEHRTVRTRTYDRDHRVSASSRHVETRRSFHVEVPQRIVRPHNYRSVPRSRYYLGIRVYRPYGYLYPGFGFYYSDNDAFRWLAFTALTLTIVNQLDEHQQRMHEQALIRATTGEEGDTLYWDDRGASGSVTVLYIGTDSRGREYREFRQTVSAHGRTETSYGSATLRANGTWQVAKLDI